MANNCCSGCAGDAWPRRDSVSEKGHWHARGGASCLTKESLIGGRESELRIRTSPGHQKTDGPPRCGPSSFLPLKNRMLGLMCLNRLLKFENLAVKMPSSEVFHPLPKVRSLPYGLLNRSAFFSRSRQDEFQHPVKQRLVRQCSATQACYNARSRYA